KERSDRSDHLARRRYHAAQLHLAEQAFRANQPARALDLVESLRPTAEEEDLRTFEWYYLWGAVQRGLRWQFRLDVLNFVCVQFLPDGKTVVASDGVGTVYFIDAETGKEQSRLKSHYGVIHGLAVSPDGRYLAACGKSPLVVWDLTTREAAFKFS